MLDGLKTGDPRVAFFVVESMSNDQQAMAASACMKPSDKAPLLEKNPGWMMKFSVRSAAPHAKVASGAKKIRGMACNEVDEFTETCDTTTAKNLWRPLA